MTFGYLEHSNDRYAYQGAAYQYCGFDELTQFAESEYRYLFSRLRRLEGSNVPVRMRAASNPGGDGHDWVYRRFFLEGSADGRPFIPAKLDDNPYLDREEYRRSLAELDPITRRQLEHGDWTAIDRSNAVVPEFTPELAARVVREDPPLEYFTPYTVMDVGSRDLHAILFGVWDFMAAKLRVLREKVLRDPSTEEIAHAVKHFERELWGDLPHAEKPRRYSDVDYRLIRDLREMYGIKFEFTAKDDALSARNTTRTHLKRGEVLVSPECKVLLATLAGALWNEKRTDYLRTPELGHADAFQALVYMDRMVERTHNPYPPAEFMGPFGVTQRMPPRGRHTRAVEKAFPKKVKPLR